MPTNDLALVGRQVATREWWTVAKDQFDLFVSPVVRREAAKGDPDAAKRRLEVLTDIPDAEFAAAVSKKLRDRKIWCADLPDQSIIDRKQQN